MFITYVVFVTFMGDTPLMKCNEQIAFMTRILYPQNVCVWRAKNIGLIYTGILEEDQGLSREGEES